MLAAASYTAQTGYHVKGDYPEDPYIYLTGFGVHHASETLPDVLPYGQNSPQKCRYGLYAEQMTATAFVAPRHLNQRTWLYRIRPAVAHQGFTPLPDNPNLESNFFPGLNPKVHISPTQLAWRPFELPKDSEQVDFVDGLKTIAGNGDPTLKSGLAIHVYTANKSMENRAFVSNDGDMLIVPQQGKLDIRTEMGKMMVRPGEICVIQRGIRWSVKLPDGPSRGYIQEVYGAHYELPELGPLGGNGLANSRDFMSPVACFDVAQDGWQIVYKLCGKLWSCTQEHTPFDVVAYHGNYVPVKYNLEKFINVGSISKDHIDPSIFCVLTVRSPEEGTPLADFLIFSPRWDVATGTFRPPYFHRNCASEFMGLLYGEYPGRSDDFLPGGASYECGFTPHGVDYEQFDAASNMDLQPMRISEGTVAFMFESSRMFTLTDFAMKTPLKHEHEPSMWDPLRAKFIDNLDEVNADLSKLGLKTIDSSKVSALSSAGQKAASAATTTTTTSNNG